MEGLAEGLVGGLEGGVVGMGMDVEDEAASRAREGEELCETVFVRRSLAERGLMSSPSEAAILLSFLAFLPVLLLLAVGVGEMVRKEGASGGGARMRGTGDGTVLGVKMAPVFASSSVCVESSVKLSLLLLLLLQLLSLLVSGTVKKKLQKEREHRKKAANKQRHVSQLVT